MTQADAKVLSEYFSGILQTAGGGSLRPWNSIYRSAQGTNESLTILVADESVDECLINSANVTSETMTMVGTFDSGNCCFEEAAWNNRQVMVLNGLGNAWRSFRVDGADQSTCTLTLNPGVAASNDVATSTTNFTSGAAILVRPSQYEVDANTHVLSMTIEDETNTITKRPLARGVFSFQVAFGYDFNPADGRVDDSNSASDEWLGNSPGESLGNNISDLRRVAVGMVVGRKAPRSSSAQVLDGPTVNVGTHYLQAVRSQVSFRNLFIYQ